MTMTHDDDATQSSDAVAAYLAEHPDFFETHPELLSHLIVPHPQNGQIISLVERQSLILRQRISALEGHLAQLKHHGAHNDALIDKLVLWARALLMQTNAAQLPNTVVDQMKVLFEVPFVALRLWDVAPAYLGLECAQPVSADIKQLTASMMAPFSGANVGFEAASWMHVAPNTIKSMAMLPLRSETGAHAFGLMVLGSEDPQRFQSAMGTDFLMRFAQLASAALVRVHCAATQAVEPSELTTD